MLLLNSPKKVLANILLEGFGEEYDGESLLKSSELGDGAYTCRERKTVISNVAYGLPYGKSTQLSLRKIDVTLSHIVETEKSPLSAH